MRRALVLVALILCVCTGTAVAKDSPDEIATRVSQEVMSPFCDGVTLHDCPSQQADELRLEIADWARAGLSEEQILARLENRYGSVISGSPSSPLAWLVPLVAVVIGIVLVVVLARRWGGRGGGRDAGFRGPGLDPQERARVEAELAHFNRREML